MARNELYQIHETPEGYRCQKFDMDYEPKGHYDIGVVRIQEGRHRLECSCFASNKETCRHRKMVALFYDLKRMGGGWYYDFDREKWHDLGSKVQAEFDTM